MRFRHEFARSALITLFRKQCPKLLGADQLTFCSIVRDGVVYYLAYDLFNLKRLMCEN